MVTLHSANRREGLTRKGGDYADKVIDVLNEMGYLVEDRAADSGIFADIELSRKFSDEMLITEAKNTDFEFSEYLGGLGHYFAHWYDGNFDRFYLFVKILEKDEVWNTITNAEDDNEELEDLFEKILDEAADEFDAPTSQIYLDDFRDFLANTEVWQYSHDELDRIHERIDRTHEYDDKPFLTDYEPIPEDGILYSNLFEITTIPDTLYRVETIDGFAEAQYRNYNPDYYPLEPHGGYLYSLVKPSELLESTRHYIEEDSVNQTSFPEWITPTDKDTDDITRALLVKLAALKARVSDCRYNRGNNGALLYARYGEEYGEKRRSDDTWIAQPAQKRSEYLHRAVWIETKHFASTYYFVFKPTWEFTTNGETPVGPETKSELTHKFARRDLPKNRRTRRVIDAWETLLQNPQQARLNESQHQKTARTDVPFRSLASALQLSRVDGFVLPSRPPGTSKEQRELIQSPEIVTQEDRDFIEDMEQYL